MITVAAGVSDTENWALVVGFISATFVLPVLQQPTFTARTRSLVTFGWSILTGLGTAWVTGAFGGVHDVRAAVTTILLVLVAAISTYHGFARPTGIAPAIEATTSPVPVAVEVPRHSAEE